ncbi:MAG: 3-dehydroquinate synthase [Candidatus Cyclobacteriaceae bacterium M3_2C_046]
MNQPEAKVIISDDHQELLSDYLWGHNYSKIAVLVDENTQQHCLPLLGSSVPEAEVYAIPSGEENKNLTTCSMIWQFMTDQQMDRKSILINLGGGVIGDMGGFCAATYKRGIDFINLPTTLLAQVDASIGGKLGIDFSGFKNHIGVFQEPQRVIIQADFLKTLPERELRSGYAEVIKHSLIADRNYWPRLTQNSFNQQPWKEHIAHSIQVKQQVVDQDPKEKGLRKILNFGHTIGHAVESYFLAQPTQKLLHGEAIAIGMICESFLSVKKCGLDQAEMTEITHYLLQVYGKMALNPASFQEILLLTLQDKKNMGGKVKAALLNRIGEAVFDVEIDQQDIIAGLDYYNSL